MEIKLTPPPREQNRGRKIAIVVGGGPAPGINGVIRAVTMEGLSHGMEVIGIQDGFYWLARGDANHTIQLTEDVVFRIHRQGGAILGTSREAPTKSQAKLQATIDTLRALEVDHLVTIGGDDTGSTATAIDRWTGNEITCAHVPKTIDNDLPLPSELPTFGYRTARQVGTDLVGNLMEDAKTTGRWYFVVAMGRSAGHLALGIGKAASAAITVIPEEFRPNRVPLETLSRILEGTILKCAARGQGHGVAVIAEGVAEWLDPADLSGLENVERDEHGHVRLAELPFGEILKKKVRGELAAMGHKVTIVDKNIGYELRCAAPTADDMEYTRDLGSGAVRALREGQSGVLICVDGAELKPLSFEDLKDPETNRMSTRRVDIKGQSYAWARSYMDRLTGEDLSGSSLEGLAQLVDLDAAEFKTRYDKVV